MGRWRLERAGPAGVRLDELERLTGLFELLLELALELVLELVFAPWLEDW